MCLKFYVLFQNFPNPLRSVYYPNGMILAILHREMPNMLPAKYQPNQSRYSEEEVVSISFPL